jgi:DNA-binding NarL/FixJ family response regulator
VHREGREVTAGEMSVLVVDQTMVAFGLGCLIDLQHDLRVVGVATSGSASVRGAKRWAPSVVVMADRLSDGPGTGAAEAVLEATPGTRVVMITGTDPELHRTEAQAAGCAAVVGKSQPVEHLLAAVRAVHAGSVTDGSARSAAARPVRRLDLSRRQLEVLALLADGASTEAIATELYLSVNTVRNHVQRTIRRLGAHSRLEAVAIALREGLISLP